MSSLLPIIDLSNLGMEGECGRAVQTDRARDRQAADALGAPVRGRPRCWLVPAGRARSRRRRRRRGPPGQRRAGAPPLPGCCRRPATAQAEPQRERRPAGSECGRQHQGYRPLLLEGPRGSTGLGRTEKPARAGRIRVQPAAAASALPSPAVATVSGPGGAREAGADERRVPDVVEAPSLTRPSIPSAPSQDPPPLTPGPMSPAGAMPPSSAPSPSTGGEHKAPACPRRLGPVHGPRRRFRLSRPAAATAALMSRTSPPRASRPPPRGGPRRPVSQSKSIWLEASIHTLLLLRRASVIR